MQIDLWRNNLGNWEKANRPLIVTYGESGATDSRNDPVDTAVGWTHKFADTVPGEYGITTRDSAFGDSILTKDARPLDSTSNVLLEGYHNSSVYAENEQHKLEILVDDPNFFGSFNIVQRAEGCFNPDSRYSGATTLSTILDPSGHGELNFTSQGSPWDAEYEIDFLTGPIFSFDIFPSGGTSYSYTGPFVIEEGTYAVFHQTTPEPSSLAMLGGVALAGIGYAGSRMIRRK
ncbi:MAG: PEP-CTERM sorting domain-containing protein [Nanoarchaeota archaeon]|nr:PEP-CTERM sorting domain-containing protein [Nanoarchaeota archaeon]